MSKSAQHFHLRRAAFPLGPFQPLDLAQKDFLLAASFLVRGFGAGAFNFDPVALFYLALPFAVKPPPCFTDNFSPLFTLKVTFFLQDFFLHI